MSSKIAARYASGLLEFTQEQQQTDHLFDEMKTVVGTVKASKDLQRFLASPFIESAKKISVTNEVFRTLSVTARNFIALIIKHGRETQLEAIAKKFLDNVEDLRGVQRVSFVSAAPLSEDVIKRILEQSGLINDFSKYDLTTTVDESLIGGYILRAKDQQIDASVRTKLAALRKNFQQN